MTHTTPQEKKDGGEQTEQGKVAASAFKRGYENGLQAGRYEMIDKALNILILEISDSHKEGIKTSRLTSAYNKINALLSDTTTE